MYCYNVGEHVGKEMIHYIFRRYLASNTILFIPFCYRISGVRSVMININSTD